MINKITTGVDYIDQSLDGGHVAQNVYGLLGPTPSGKTTLGVTIATEGAKIQHRRAARGQTSGTWYFFSLEQPGRQIMNLAVSHLAKIDRRSIDKGMLSKVPQGRAYEIGRADELRRADGTMPTERERYEAACEIIKSHLHVFDWNLERTFAGCLTPMQFVSNQLDEQARSGSVAGVVIDYLSLLVDGFIGSVEGNTPWRQSTLIRQAVVESKRMIAEKFDCPMWIIHQLNGNANRRSHLEVSNHTDAKGCKKFGDGLDFCFSLGVQDPQSGCVQLARTKPLVGPPRPILLDFDPNFASLVESRDHRHSRTLHKIVREGYAQVETDDYTRELVERMFARDSQRSD